LHIHGAAFTPPAGFTTRIFEHWLSRGEENLIIAGEGTSSERQSQTLQAMTPLQRTILERMDRRVEQAYAAIDRSDLRVIHCDLWHDNIKLQAGQLLPFDFEDTIWGFRCHDIAMAMLDLQDETDASAYPQLFATFKRGYSALLPWPTDPIEPCQMGRLLWKINWVAGHEPQWLPSMVERYASVFEGFKKTGAVVLPG
jgi:Ser/Thr protein kinase RdoA (MazF antagonist)